MSEDGGGKPTDDGDAEDDPLLRAIAAAPALRPEGPDPTQLAHFRIVLRLGAGGMGVVYRAEDEKLRRAVALKVLPDTSDDEEKRQRFLREARSAAAVTHPNVAVVYEVDEADGRVYIAMELVDGENLRARIQRGRLDVARAKDLALQIGRGLAAAHDKGIVHRDLKPENVMITPAGAVKLLDFGLAKVAKAEPLAGKADPALAKTETLVTSDEGRIMGTPDYMSPEQAFGEPVDVRSDVFSFGIVLYEMLVGTRPFEGRTTGALLMAIARDAAPGLRERAPEVDEATAAVVMKCLAKKPGDRFATAGEVVAALEGKADATTRSLSDVAPVTRRGRARSSRVMGLAAAMVLGTAGIGASVFLRRPREPAIAAAPSVSAAAVSAGEISRSSNTAAQQFFVAALRSIHDDTAASTGLLRSAVKADPIFGGAYLRLWWKTRDEPAEHPDESYQHVLALRDGMSTRDRELFDSLESAAGAARNARLDAYLAQYPTDDVAWTARLDSTEATAGRALAADPTLVNAMAGKAWAIRSDGRVAEALAQLDRCLEISPNALTCVWRRSILLNEDGKCAEAEPGFRRMLELDPHFGTARITLASDLIARGASVAAVREATGAEALGGAYSPELVGAISAMLAGEFAEVERLATAALASVPSTADESDHWESAHLLRDAYAESGDAVRAGEVAADYLSRRTAWNPPAPSRVGAMVGAAIRGGHLGRADGDRQLDAAFRAQVEAGISPGDAWARTYAEAETAAEARVAYAKLDALHVDMPTTIPSSSAWRGRPGQVLFLVGRGEAARAMLEGGVQSCLWVVYDAHQWARSHLFLGELDEQRHDKPAACGHFAKILERWGHAKPRSVTADEAHAHATKLGCTP